MANTHKIRTSTQVKTQTISITNNIPILPTLLVSINLLPSMHRTLVNRINTQVNRTNIIQANKISTLHRPLHNQMELIPDTQTNIRSQAISICILNFLLTILIILKPTKVTTEQV